VAGQGESNTLLMGIRQCTYVFCLILIFEPGNNIWNDYLWQQDYHYIFCKHTINVPYFSMYYRYSKHIFYSLAIYYVSVSVGAILLLEFFLHYVLSNATSEFFSLRCPLFSQCDDYLFPIFCSLRCGVAHG
jgi:hypothetical protein